MNILVLTKDAKHQEKVFTQDLLGFISKNVDGICQFKRHEYNDDSVKLYRAIDRNDVQVIFIDDNHDGNQHNQSREIADKILRNYGRNCPDLVGFSSISGHEQNPTEMEDISRNYDYVYFKFSDKGVVKGLCNYLRRKVIRYKSKHGELGLITRNLNGFFFNNKSIDLTDQELRFLTVLFDKKNIDTNCAERADFCNEFKDTTYTLANPICTEVKVKVGDDFVDKNSYLALNQKLKHLINRLNNKLKGMAKDDGFKLEGHNKYERLIVAKGIGVECKWCYRNKIEASKKDICND